MKYMQIKQPRFSQCREARLFRLKYVIIFHRVQPSAKIGEIGKFRLAFLTSLYRMTQTMTANITDLPPSACPYWRVSIPWRNARNALM